LQGAYASLNKWHELQVSIDAVYTDDYDCGTLGVDWCTINGYTNLNALNSIVTSFWKDGFQIVSQLNRIINYTGNVQDPDMTAAEKTLAVAKAKGLKGVLSADHLFRPGAAAERHVFLNKHCQCALHAELSLYRRLADCSSAKPGNRCFRYICGGLQCPVSEITHTATALWRCTFV
jgi:hypothetical protein